MHARMCTCVHAWMCAYVCHTCYGLTDYIYVSLHAGCWIYHLYLYIIGFMRIVYSKLRSFWYVCRLVIQIGLSFLPDRTDIYTNSKWYTRSRKIFLLRLLSVFKMQEQNLWKKKWKNSTNFLLRNWSEVGVLIAHPLFRQMNRTGTSNTAAKFKPAWKSPWKNEGRNKDNF